MNSYIHLYTKYLHSCSSDEERDELQKACDTMKSNASQNHSNLKGLSKLKAEFNLIKKDIENRFVLKILNINFRLKIMKLSINLKAIYCIFIF